MRGRLLIQWEGMGLVLVLAVLLLLSSCAAPVKEFTVEGSEFKFSPASITVDKGDKVKITFNNVGRFGHDFVIEGMGVATPVIKSGETTTAEFTADTSGTLTFFCSVKTNRGAHRDAGMEEEITVR